MNGWPWKGTIVDGEASIRVVVSWQGPPEKILREWSGHVEDIVPQEWANEVRRDLSRERDTSIGRILIQQTEESGGPLFQFKGVGVPQGPLAQHITNWKRFRSRASHPCPN